MRSEHVNELAAALAKAQGQIQPAARSGENPAFKRENKSTRYSTLGDIWDACRAPLSANGLCVVQTMEEADGVQYLVTCLLHASGQWMDSHATLRPVQNTPQGVGSALTYMRRYQLAAMLGVAADDDDDGNEASGATTAAPKGQAQQAGAQRLTAPKPAPQPQVQPAQPAHIEPEPDFSGGQTNGTADRTLDDLRGRFHAKMTAIFGGLDVDAARHWYVRDWTSRETATMRESSKDLTAEELAAILTELTPKVTSRIRANYIAWAAKPATA